MKCDYLWEKAGSPDRDFSWAIMILVERIDMIAVNHNDALKFKKWLRICHKRSLLSLFSRGMSQIIIQLIVLILCSTNWTTVFVKDFHFFLFQKYQVTFSMLEIYNEQVRDLLTKDNPKGGLPVSFKICTFLNILVVNLN